MATVANMPPTEPAARYQSSDAVPAPSSPAARLLGDYRIVKTLGEGTFAKVKLAVHVVSQMKVAIKVIDKRTISDKYVLQNLHREAQIMKRISHPNVIRFYEEIETDNEYCLVMEHAGGGEILDYIVAHGKLSEKETRRFIRQVVSAVEHLHQIGIVHRDLKAENLLLDDNMNIKIIDFGLSNNFEVGELLRTRCGSFEYTAPELIASKAYVGPGIDVWTIGVNLYAMLTGCLPFVSDNVATIYSLQVAEKYDVPHDISPGCRAFLKTLLTVDPTKRPSIGEVRMHPWLNKDCEPLQEWKGAAYDGELDALNEDVIARLVSAGFDREKVIRSARGNACNREAAAYRLLKQSPLMRSSSGSRTAAVPPRKAHSVSTADAASTSQRHSVAGVPHPTRPAAAYPAISGNASIAATSAAKREKEIIVGGQVARGGLASLLDDEDDDNNVITSGMPQRPPVQELPEPRRRAETADNTVAGSKRRSDSITSESSLVSETIEDLNVSGNAGSRPVSGRRPSNENSLPQIDGATGSSPATMRKQESAERRKSGGLFAFFRRTKRPSVATTDAADVVRSGSPSPQASTPTPAPADAGARFAFSITSSKRPEKILREIKKVLQTNGVRFADGERDSVLCAQGELRFEIQVCKIQGLELNGVRFRRVAGDIWHYTTLSRVLVANIKI